MAEPQHAPSLTIIEQIMPADKGFRVVFALETPVKRKWWRAPDHYKVEPVFFWALTHEALPNGRSDDYMMPMIRANGRMFVAPHVPNYIGLLRPDDKDDALEGPVAIFLVKLAQKRAKAAKDAEESKKNQLLN